MIVINKYKPLTIAAAISTALLLTACGSSDSSNGSATTGATNSVASKGVITGFGSVYVNGIKYETTNTNFTVDGEAEKDQTNLKVGMVVKVTGTVNSDGTTGVASSISYNDELKGPISAITVSTDGLSKTLTILGKTVIVGVDTVFDTDFGLDFATLAVNDVVEVSGLVTAAGIQATHIEKQGAFDPSNPASSKIEMVGTVSKVNSAGFSLDGLNVQVDANTQLKDNLTLADGMYVEVKGTLDATGTTLTATKISSEEKGLGEQELDKAELEGVISNYDATAQTFEIQGQSVDFSTAKLKPANLSLKDGLSVEVEGPVTQGILKAKEVKQRGQKLKIKAPLSAVDVDAGTVSFVFNGTTLTARVNQQTEMEDESSAQLSTMTLSDLSSSDFVELKAFYDGSSTINAYGLKRKDSGDTKLQGPVDTFDAPNKSVTVFGIQFDLSNATIVDETAFYNALSGGQFVEIKDKGNDGVIDEAALDD